MALVCATPTDDVRLVVGLAEDLVASAMFGGPTTVELVNIAEYESSDVVTMRVHHAGA